MKTAVAQGAERLVAEKLLIPSPCGRYLVLVAAGIPHGDRTLLFGCHISHLCISQHSPIPSDVQICVGRDVAFSLYLVMISSTMVYLVVWRNLGYCSSTTAVQ